MDPYLGEIRMVGFNFVPRGWALCDGTILPIQQNAALFSILGTTYGGDGRTTFALPDLRGRAPMHTGMGAGLTDRSLGEPTGVESVTLAVPNLPAHTHGMAGVSEPGTLNSPNGALPASGGGFGASASTVAMATTEGAGGGQAINNRSASLGITFIIALSGVFPARG
jgi:microcystin-dependent protein